MKLFKLFAVSLTLLMSLVAAAEEAAPAVDPPQEDPERVKLREIISKMRESAKNLKSYSVTIHERELFGKELSVLDVVKIKWQAPQRVYINYVKGPFAGREVIYYQGWNNNEVRAHEGGFLGAINVNLDPYGNMAMKGNHHPAAEVSLVRFVRVLAHNIEKADERGEGTVKITENVKLWGWDTTKIECTAPKGGRFYTMKDDETLFDVAKKYNTSMYLILHHNPKHDWDEADDADEGDKVFVPRYYAGKMVLWIDTEVWMPIKAEIYDHFGRLYEDYEHRDLKVNVPLSRRVFDPDNKEYNF